MQNTTPKTYDYPQFTEEMRRDYTILVPNMLPVQLGLICRLMRNYGYKMELLHTEGPNIAEQGLRNVHNDTCYPALLVIGQLIDAIQSGRYDVHKIAHPPADRRRLPGIQLYPPASQGARKERLRLHSGYFSELFRS